MAVLWQGLHGRHLSQRGYVCLHMPAPQTLRILCEQLCCHSAASRRLMQGRVARGSRQRTQAAKEEVTAQSDNSPEASGALEQVVAPQQSEAQAAESRCDAQAVSRSGHDACIAMVRVHIQALHMCNLCICAHCQREALWSRSCCCVPCAAHALRFDALITRLAVCWTQAGCDACGSMARSCSSCQSCQAQNICWTFTTALSCCPSGGCARLCVHFPSSITLSALTTAGHCRSWWPCVWHFNLTCSNTGCVQARLKRGVLPVAGEAPWPAEPFRTGFLQVLNHQGNN